MKVLVKEALQEVLAAEMSDFLVPIATSGAASGRGIEPVTTTAAWLRRLAIHVF